MKTKIIGIKSLLLKVLLVLPLVFLTYCQDKGEEVIDANEGLMFTKYSEISTLMKAAVAADDDAQCVHYEYPITFYAQLSTTSSIEVVTINSDDELFNFFDRLSGSDEVRIDFPIDLRGIDGDITEINTLDELTDTLQTVVDACSGNANYEYCHPNNKKVYICHNGNTICVSVNAINAHLDHGDALGQCQ